jgi:Ca2+-binding RTX toxin-like protein
MPTPAPTSVTSVTTSPVSGDLGVGAVVTLTLTFSAPVTIASGSPTVVLNDGGTASYQSGSGTSSLVFAYTVAAGEDTSDLSLASNNAIILDGSTLTDGSGNAVDLTGANGLAPPGALQIDTTTPVVPPGNPTGVTLANWGQLFTGGDGSYSLTGAAGGSNVTLGNGDDTVNVTGANNILTTGNGNENITYNGAGNTITTGDGTNTITVNGDYADISIAAPQIGTTDIQANGWQETITSTGTGNVNVTGPTGQSTITLGDGNDTVAVGSYRNIITVGVGTDTITASGAGAGQNVITTGGGADTITVTGWNNVLNAGPGMNFLNGGTGSDTFYLNGPGQGIDTLTGFLPTNGDILNLSRTLALATTAVDLTNVGNFITAVASGGNTTLYVDDTGGHGTATAFAVLDGVTTTIATLVKNNEIKLS